MDVRNILLNSIRRTPSKVLIIFITFMAVGTINYRYKILYKIYNDYIFSNKTEKRKIIFELACKT
jgi:hypothetical protein